MTSLSRARWLEVWTESSREQAFISEHRRLLGYIRSGQAEEAAREASAHVRDTRDRLLCSLNGYWRGLRARGGVDRRAAMSFCHLTEVASQHSA